MRKRQIIIWIVFIVFVVLIIIGNIVFSFNDHTYTCTVTDKNRIYSATSSQTLYYLIYCKDDQGNYYEFKNSDNLFRLKFRSSTVYNKIEVGKTYKFIVVGYRIGILSSYENIIDFEEVN